MKDHTQNYTGTICPVCRKLLDPQDNNEWDDYLQAILCPHCDAELFYWLVAYENPEQRLIDAVESLSGKPYWMYQINELDQNDTLDDETMVILRNARAKLARSKFTVIRGGMDK